jgi:hypothetical protein
MKDQWSRREDSDINPHSYSHIFNKEPKAHDGEKIASSPNLGGKTGYQLVED